MVFLIRTYLILALRGNPGEPYFAKLLFVLLVVLLAEKDLENH